jgi:hypothetical protein
MSTCFLRASSSKNSISSLNLSFTLFISYSVKSLEYYILKEALPANYCLAREEEGECNPEPSYDLDIERSSPILKLMWDDKVTY